MLYVFITKELELPGWSVITSFVCVLACLSVSQVMIVVMPGVRLPGQFFIIILRWCLQYLISSVLLKFAVINMFE